MTVTGEDGIDLRIDPRIRERRNKVARSKGRRRLYLILAAFMVVGGYFAARAMLRTSLFSVRNFDITGSQHYSGSYISARSGVPVGFPLTEVNPGIVAKRLEQLPWDATVQVKKKWPDTLRISVENRAGLAVIPGPGKDELLVDPSGRVLASEPVTKGKWLTLCYKAQVTSSAALAQATGCETPSTAPGADVSARYKPLLLLAAQLQSDPVAKFSRLVVSSSGEVDGELSNGLAVRFGSLEQLSQKFRALKLILAQASTTGFSTIDLRVPQEPVMSHW